MIKIEFDTNVINDTYLPLLYNNSDVLVLMGGAGSGKSWFALTKLIFRSLTEKGIRCPLVRKVSRTIKDSSYQMMKDIIATYGLEEFFEYNETYMRIYNKATNCLFYALGMDDSEKVKSLAQPNNMFIEEASELTYDDWIQLGLRIRGKPLNKEYHYKQIIVAFNPVDTDNWTHKEFFPPHIDSLTTEQLAKRNVKRLKNLDVYHNFKLSDVAAIINKEIKVQNKIFTLQYCVCRSNYYDNRFLEDSDKASIEALIKKSENAYRVYCKAEWGSVGSLVFENPFPVIRLFPNTFDDVFYGMDFGYHHPTVLMEIGMKDGWYYVTEKMYVTHKTKYEIVEMMKEQKLVKPDSIIYADNAEPDTIALLRENGFEVVESIKGAIKDGLDFLKSVKIFSLYENTNFNREVRSYKWKTDREGKPIEGSPVPENDDCISAVRYAITTHAKTTKIQLVFI